MPDSQVPKPTPPAPVRRRWLKRLVVTFVVLLLALLGAIGAIWWWAGQADSLQRTLERVAHWLPADQKLEARGVEGSVRRGGSIEWLRWSNPTLQVEVKNAEIAWSLRPLLSRAMHFSQVNVESLRIHSTPGPKDDTPTQPLQSLELPVRIDLPLRVENFVWEGPPNIELSAFYAHYRYTGSEHELDITSLRYADGLYEAKAKLQAASPMQIQATLQGQLQTAMPLQPEETLQIVASASVDGTLATEAARLQIKAQAQVPNAADQKDEQEVDPSQIKSKPDSQKLSATADAVIFPWRSQLLEQADIELQHMNAAWFMPDGPETDLNGHLQAGPDNEGWQLEAAFTNLISGPWDQHALPVRSINASVKAYGSLSKPALIWAPKVMPTSKDKVSSTPAIKCLKAWQNWLPSTLLSFTARSIPPRSQERWRRTAMQNMPCNSRLSCKQLLRALAKSMLCV